MDREKGFSQDQPPAETVTLMLRPKGNDIPKLQRKITEEEERKRNKERDRDGSSSSSCRNNICQNEITATNATDVGVSNFGNYAVQGKGGSEGTKGFPDRGGGYNISGNKISADGARKVGIHNFGNTTYGMPFTTEEDHGEEAEGGSSPPKPQGEPTG